MRHERAATLCLVLAALLSGCGEPGLAPRDDVAMAEAAIDGWIGSHPSGWAAATSSAGVAPVRPDWTPSCADPQSNGYVSLRLTTERGEIELAFRCPLAESATIEDLQSHFVRAVPWNLPTGITAPNWRFQAWLPLSSIFDGVTFHTPRPGLLAVDIQSSMLGIRAENTRSACLDRGAGGSSACVLAREHRVPLQLRFTVLHDLAALR